MKDMIKEKMNLSVSINISDYKQFKVRSWIAVQLIKLAASIIWCRCNIKLEGK